MCELATKHDLSDAFQLLGSNGWATLLAILETAGERPQKRASPSKSDGRDEDQRTKRFKRTSLNR